VEFDYPDELKAEIDEYNQSTAPQQMGLLIAPHCDRTLRAGGKLSDNDAQKLSDLLDSAISQPGDEEKQRERNKVALAATLAACANDWLRSKPDIYERVTSIIRETIKTVGDSSEGGKFTARCTLSATSIIEETTRVAYRTTSART
jgi:hypothetical protein